ncbi:Holliday junction resolvase-like protein [Fictibacillus macauensis ZFHKF-1]|uniref:Putative pre-16S rRNA nuclease n=1 Tax=Fictibacillus macauensis ZFHKF-1 TaxID=1196324 RepID=I8J0K5_9BACL|nr:Holliday junction resolvase RuvX [Fictibacillus macauensis]EIT85286.1 Holliday junction resolvase-like protein [Fictibacillus macauensis ZFHKF-1]
MPRVLGLDVGSHTVGVAVSDSMGWTAQGIETVKRKPHQPDEVFERIGEWVTQYEVEAIVVGLPKNMNGSIGPSGEACQAFAAQAQERYNVPVVLWDERLTTMAAEKMLISADVSRKKRKQVIDKMAAVLILQGYLDRQQLNK